MADYKEPKDMTVAELCERFEKDIYNGMHSLGAEFSRSSARRELEKRGKAILSEIEAYRANPSRYVSDGSNMAKNVVIAWSSLFESIGKSSEAVAH